MKSISINTKVVNGTLKQNRTRIKDAIEAFEGRDIVLTLKRRSKQRSLNQNAYYWAVLIPLTYEGIKNTWGDVYDNKQVHDFLKGKFLFTERYNEQTGEVVQLPKSTTENTTIEQEEYHTEIRQFLKEWFNIDAPLPGEHLQLEF